MDNALTLADLRATLDPDGLMAKVVDTMSTSGHLTEDGIWLPTNAFGKNVTPRTTSVPQGELRRPNRGVGASKGGISQVEDYVAYIEAMSTVDDKTIRSVGKGQKMATRAIYDGLFATGLAKQGRDLTIYGDRSSDGESFNGMAVKRNAIGEYCLDAYEGAGQTKFTSIYLNAWDQDAGVHYLYPKETTAGISTEDFGRQVIPDAINTDVLRYLPMWITWFYYDLGFAVKDDRALIRVANINPDSVDPVYLKKVMTLLNQANRKCNFTADSGKMRMYMNSETFTFFDNMRHLLDNFNMQETTISGKTFSDAWHGIPFRECDEIKLDEVQVV